MSQHLDESRVAGLIMSDERDAERVAALSHAAECEPCRVVLDEARRSLAFLEQLPAEEPPSVVALASARAAVHAELDREAGREVASGAPEAVRSRAITRWLPAVATAGAWALTVLASRHRDVDRLPLSSLGAALAVVAAMLAVGGRKVALLAIGVTSVALAVSMTGAGAELAHSGVKCAVIELLAAALPLGSVAWLATSSRLPGVQGGARFAAAGAAGALAGQAGLVLTCANHDGAHLLLAHVGTVALAAMVGVALSRRPRFQLGARNA